MQGLGVETGARVRNVGVPPGAGKWAVGRAPVQAVTLLVFVERVVVKLVKS